MPVNDPVPTVACSPFPGTVIKSTAKHLYVEGKRLGTVKVSTSPATSDPEVVQQMVAHPESGHNFRRITVNKCSTIPGGIHLNIESTNESTSEVSPFCRTGVLFAHI